MNWDWVDLIIIGAIFLSVLTGFIRGLVKEIVALCVWILSLWIAFHYSMHLDPWLRGYISDETARKAAAFVLLLLASLIVGGLFNAVLSFILKRSSLSGTDRLLGMGFGFVRGIFIVSLIIMVAKISFHEPLPYVEKSRLYTKFDPMVTWLYSLMPGMIKQAQAITPLNQMVDITDKAAEEG
jgi:membrane protein required for colicin V production